MCKLDKSKSSSAKEKVEERCRTSRESKIKNMKIKGERNREKSGSG